MVFCVTRNVWLSHLEKFLKKPLREGNIKPPSATSGEGQREARAIPYLERAKTTPKNSYWIWKLKITANGKKNVIAVGHALPSGQKYFQQS